MSDQNAETIADKPAQGRPTALGIYDKMRPERITSIEIIAIALSALWLLGALVFYLIAPDTDQNSNGLGGLRLVMTILAIFMPLALIWIAAVAARTSKMMREESKRLQSSIDAIRHAYVAQQQGGHIRTEPSVARRLDELTAAARKTEALLASFANQQEEMAMAPEATADPNTEQPALALETSGPAMVPLLATEDLIRALNFPETTDDEAGFAALRRALKHRTTSQMVHAAQDILTLLSQDGIYMDDLPPDPVQPEIWRRFARGERGPSVAELGGIKDPECLEHTATRLKQDPIFRDAAHHFMRRYDSLLAAFEEGASDIDITALADTRTSRAFMLLARVAGTFD